MAGGQHFGWPGAPIGLADALSRLAVRAGAAILQIEAGGLHPRLKADMSPVSRADEAAQAIIVDGLARLVPQLPVVSEEAPPPDLGDARSFFLVDPLDGTREFLAGLTEFTVNIALIEAGAPVLGVIVAPALRLLWRGGVEVPPERFGLTADDELDPRTRIGLSVRPFPATRPAAMVSRSHFDAASALFLQRLGNVERRPCGSSLKFCRIAEGQADLYPRLAPTHEWDVAAGDAILRAAGGAVLDANGAPLVYGGRVPGLSIPAFVAWGDPRAARRLGAAPILTD